MKIKQHKILSDINEHNTDTRYDARGYISQILNSD